MSRSNQGIINERIRNRINAKLNYEECIREGRCYKCYILITEINSKTNKKYHACKSCRIRHDYLAKLRS